MWESFGTCMLNGLLYACTIRVQYQDAPSLPPHQLSQPGQNRALYSLQVFKLLTSIHLFDQVQSFELRQNRERYKYTGSDPGKGAGKQCDVAKRKWEESGR